MVWSNPAGSRREPVCWPSRPSHITATPIQAKEKAAVAAAFSSPSDACDQSQIFLRTVTRLPWLLMRCLTTTRQ